MEKHSNDSVMVILAVATFVFPILFGFIVWKLTQIFVTKESFADYKSTADEQRAEMRRKLEDIDRNVVRILELRIAEAAAVEVLKLKSRTHHD